MSPCTDHQQLSSFLPHKNYDCNREGSSPTDLGQLLAGGGEETRAALVPIPLRPLRPLTSHLSELTHEIRLYSRGLGLGRQSRRAVVGCCFQGLHACLPKREGPLSRAGLAGWPHGGIRPAHPAPFLSNLIGVRGRPCNLTSAVRPLQDLQEGGVWIFLIPAACAVPGGPAKPASETPERQGATSRAERLPALALAGVGTWASRKGAWRTGLGSRELREGGGPGQAEWTVASPSPSQVRLLGHGVRLPGTAGSGLQHGALLFHSGPASPPAAEVTGAGAGAGRGKPWD